MSGSTFALKMPTPPLEPDTYDSGDVKQVKRKRERAASKDEQRRNDFKTLLGMAEGRRILCWILEQTGPYRGSFATNALQMAYAEGLRKLGLVITDEMAAADPEAWVAMQLAILVPTKEDSNV